MSELPEFLNNITAEAREQLVAKGIRLILLANKKLADGTIQPDATKNILKGWPIGNFQGSGDTADSEEYQDQLSGGVNKTFIGGGIDPGDVTLSTYFGLELGKPDIKPVEHSRTIVPQFLLMFATTTDTVDKLQVWWSAGVNYLGGGGFDGQTGKSPTSQLKFKVTGTVNSGTKKNGLIDKSIYNAGGTTPE